MCIIGKEEEEDAKTKAQIFTPNPNRNPVRSFSMVWGPVG